MAKVKRQFSKEFKSHPVDVENALIFGDFFPEDNFD